MSLRLAWALGVKDYLEALVVSEEASLFGHHEVLRRPIVNALVVEGVWKPLAEHVGADASIGRRGVAPEGQELQAFAGRFCRQQLIHRPLPAHGSAPFAHRGTSVGRGPSESTCRGEPTACPPRIERT